MLLLAPPRPRSTSRGPRSSSLSPTHGQSRTSSSLMSPTPCRCRSSHTLSTSNGAAAPKYPPFVESVRRRRLNVSDIGCEVLSRGWFSAGGQPHTVAAGWPRWHASWAPGRPTSTCGCWRVSRWCLTSNSTLLFVIGVTNRIKRSKVQHENRNKKTKREAKEHRRTERRSIRLQKGRNP